MRRGERGVRAGGARLRLAALLALVPLTLLPLAEATAQQRSAPARSATKPQEKEKEPPPPAEPPPAPYDRDLLRLSEIVGALAFLRNLCTAPDAAEWPARMKAILDTEGVTQSRRDRLAGAYNRGFRGYSLTYRVCTPAAGEAARRYIAEGERLSHAIAGRFGG
ncbi:MULTISPECIES: TIGR02301 family protein [unclassified Methylobacterium]|uniref:TIGR02301 family protein n=1 Tax=unclassified Methylobacterium TaxID=2615210 RepID=UPI0036FFED27